MLIITFLILLFLVRVLFIDILGFHAQTKHLSGCLKAEHLMKLIIGHITGEVISECDSLVALIQSHYRFMILAPGCKAQTKVFLIVIMLVVFRSKLHEGSLGYMGIIWTWSGHVTEVDHIPGRGDSNQATESEVFHSDFSL